MGGAATEISDDHHPGAGRGRPLGRRRRCSAPARRHKLTSEAGKRNERGVDPTVTRGRGRPRGRAARRARRRHRRARASPWSARAAGRPHRRSPPTCPRASPGMPIDADDRGRAPARPSAARSTARRRRARRRPAAVAPRPHRPLRPRRGGRPDRRLRPGAVGAARPRPPAAGSPAPSGCGAGSAAPWPGAGYVEVVSFPFVGDADLDELGLPADDAAPHHGAAGQPAVGRGAVLHHHAAAGPAHDGRAATSAAAPPASRCSRPAQVAFPRRPRPAPIYGVDRRPTTPSSPSCSTAVPAQPLHLARRAGGRARARRLVGRRAARRPGPTRSAPCAGSPPSSASTSRCAPATGCRGTRAAAPRSSSAGAVRRPRRRAAPHGLPRLGPAAARRGRRGRPRRAARRRARRRARPGVLHASRWPRRTSRCWSTPPCPRPRSRRPCARAPATCSSRSGSSTSTPASRSVRAAVAGLRAALPGPRPHPDRGETGAPRATRRSRWPPSGAGPSSAADAVPTLTSCSGCSTRSPSPGTPVTGERSQALLAVARRRPRPWWCRRAARRAAVAARRAARPTHQGAAGRGVAHPHPDRRRRW